MGFRLCRNRNLTDTNNFTVRVEDNVVCDIPLEALDAPELQRPTEKVKREDINIPVVTDFDMNWVWEQYDSQVIGNTIQGPQADPAIVRIPNSKKAIAMTTLSCAPFCYYNPRSGIRNIIYDCYYKLMSVNAIPLGITNCLNFGNPENPSVMHDFKEVCIGMSETCEELLFPVVSGNVSFYNETSGKGIMPTPVIGGVGLIQDYENSNYNISR